MNTTTPPALAPRIIRATKAIFDAREEFQKTSPQRRAQIATAVDRIADVLGGMSTDIRGGAFPAAKATEVITRARDLPDAFGAEVGETKANEIADALKEVAALQQIVAVRSDAVGRDHLGKLDGAVAVLRMLSEYLRAG